MTDEKKIKDEELANITGAGPELGDQKTTPTGGGGATESKVDTTGDNQTPSEWSAD